jgi:RNA polymerase sigma-70 factor, ECF subfamily
MAACPSDPLLTRLSKGDEGAFALLYDQYGARLLRTATALLGHREDAEDAVQEVFMGLLRSRRLLTEIDDLAAYLFAALRHAAAHCAARRRKSNTGAHFLDIASPNESHVDRIARDELHEAVWCALLELPPEQREVVSFRLAGELTFAQIGRATQVSTQTAVSRYRYGLEKLRLLLKEHR